MERTGIRERRIAAPDQALSDICLPAARAGARRRPASRPAVVDLLDRRHGHAGHGVPVDGRDPRRRAGHDRTRPPTTCRPAAPGFMYALAQGYGMVAAGLARARARGRRRRALADHGLDRPRRPASSSATARAPSCSSRSTAGGFLGFELGADGSGGPELYLPGRRLAAPGERGDGGRAAALRADERPRGVQVRDPRARLVGARRCSSECGKTIEDVDVYVPHQANVRIIEHARKKLGVPEESVVVNVDRYGNTSSGSIPLALADAAGRRAAHATAASC